jgi:hypothetical protein
MYLNWKVSPISLFFDVFTEYVKGRGIQSDRFFHAVRHYPQHRRCHVRRSLATSKVRQRTRYTRSKGSQSQTASKSQQNRSGAGGGGSGGGGSGEDDSEGGDEEGSGSGHCQHPASDIRKTAFWVVLIWFLAQRLMDVVINILSDYVSPFVPDLLDQFLDFLNRVYQLLLNLT